MKQYLALKAIVYCHFLSYEILTYYTWILQYYFYSFCPLID